MRTKAAVGRLLDQRLRLAADPKWRIIAAMDIFREQNAPLEQRVGSLIGDAICAALLFFFAWAYLSAFL